ncbi:MAG: hypothetical protein ACYC1M_19470 [Armatimonadota bacterium]
MVTRRNNCSGLQSILVLLLVGAVLPGSVSALGGWLTYRSSGVAAVVDASSGQLMRIENLDTKEAYKISSDTCTILTDSGMIDLSKLGMKLVSKTGRSCKFAGSNSGIEITRAYFFTKGRSYFDRTLSVKNVSGAPIVLKSVTDCSLKFEKSFESASFHNDNMDGSPGAATVTPVNEHLTSNSNNPYLTSINVFLRGNKGGLCVGLKYPYFKSDQAGDHVSLSYEPNYRLKPGETLELPTAFCSAYKKTGYSVKKELHWSPRIITSRQEVMDMGEVRAMQHVMRDYLPEQQGPADGYYMALDSYWSSIGSPEGACQIYGKL